MLLRYLRVLCIGTHEDEVKKRGGAELAAKIAEELQSHCRNKPFEVLIDGFYIVDNTTSGKRENEDVSFNEVRMKIGNFTSNDLIVKTPISWVLFRKIIQLLDDNFITLTKAYAIGKTCKIPAKALPQALLFYHDLGVLLFYPHIIGLKDVVIINPKWIIDVLSKVLTLKGREEFKTRGWWELLRSKGILVQPLYVAAWENIGEISPESLIELLVHFRLAAEVKTKEYYDLNVKQYFLPLVLPSYISDDLQSVSPDEGYSKLATPLHFVFRTKFVPPGFFIRLITSIAESSLCKIKFEEGVYRNRIQILFGDPPYDDVIFTELLDAIQVEVIRYAPESKGLKKFTNICQELLQFLLKIAKEIDECLFGKNEKSSDCKIFEDVRFICSKCKSVPPHYIYHTKGQTCVQQIRCEKSKRFRDLEKNEKLWFPDHKSSEEVVSNRLSQSEMCKIANHIISDELLHKLAAHLHMTDDLLKILQNSSKKELAGFYLLYEWDKNKIGAVREELVKILKELGQSSLAQMVHESDYNRKNSISQKKRSRTQSSDPIHTPRHLDHMRTTKSVSSSMGTRSSELSPTSISRTIASRRLDFEKKFASGQPLSPAKKKSFNDMPIANAKAAALQTVVDEQTQIKINDGLPILKSVSNADNEMSDLEATVRGSQIDDSSLHKCCNHIYKRNLKSLAAAFDVTTEGLKEIKKNYEGAGPNMHAYQLLKKWIKNNPSLTVEELQKKLRAIGHHNAASKLEAAEK